MLANRLASGALVVTCVAAAAGGGYLALRQNAANGTSAGVAVPVPTATSTSAPVQEAGAVVADATTKTASPALARPDSPPAAAKRTEPGARSATQTAARTTNPAGTGVKTSKPSPKPDLTWPSANSAPSTQPSGTGIGTTSASPSNDSSSQVARNDEPGIQEAPRTPEPPEKAFEELVVPGDSVIGLQAETLVSSERARVEDRVEGRVTRDVRIRDIVAIPAGARALGSVILVDRGGRFKERARLGIRFHTLVLADGVRLPIQTDTIYRYGDAPGNESAAKIGGGAAIGAIIGAIIGGGKGAAVGATTGAGAGTAAVMTGDRSIAVVRPGEPITVRITSPITVTIEQN